MRGKKYGAGVLAGLDGELGGLSGGVGHAEDEREGTRQRRMDPNFINKDFLNNINIG